MQVAPIRRRAIAALASSGSILAFVFALGAGTGAGCGTGPNDADECAIPGEGCGCDYEGATVACGETLSYAPGDEQATCRAGTRTCSGGKWGACVLGDQTTIQSVPSAVLKGVAPAPCADNPCDPGCMNFVDTGADIDAGSGFAVNEAGGISLTPQEAGTVSNWEGGVIDGGTPCTTGELKCQIDPCTGSGGYLATKLTGAVYDPAGKNPIPNVLVYVPNGTPVTPPDGVTCEACTTGTGDPIVSAITDYKGEFTLQGVPSGTNIPLVIQSGKWQRRITIPSITACTTNSFTKGTNPGTTPLIRFPKNRSEGNMPRIAFVSGSADPFQCVLSKMGIDVSAATSEVGVPFVGGTLNPDRIHYYQGSNNPGYNLSSSLGGGAPSANELFSGAANGAACSSNSDCASRECAGGGALSGIANPGFEDSTLTGWTKTGTNVTSVTSPKRSGSRSVKLGGAHNSNDTISQTFTVPAGSSSAKLSFWWYPNCTESSTNLNWDWMKATLRDNSTGTTVTILPETCRNDQKWIEVTSSSTLVPGRSYTLTINHKTDGSVLSTSYIDDVSIVGMGTCTGTPLLDRYDAVILACEGNDYNKGSAVYDKLVDYAARGGRIFATHYSYVYLEDAAAASNWPKVVKAWTHSNSYSDPITTYINQTFPKGESFAKWLNHVGASPTFGQMSIIEPRRDYDYVDPTRATPWMYANSSGSISGSPVGASCTSNSNCQSGVCTGVSATTVPNGGFENGNLTNWTGTGNVVATTSVRRSGSYAALVGYEGKSGSVAANDHTLSRTFTAPATGGTLSVWYYHECNDSVSYDYAKATLRNNTTGVTTTVLSNVCNSSKAWRQITANLVAGNSYTFTFTNHLDSYTSDRSWSYVDDLEIIAGGTCQPRPCTSDSDCSTLGTGAACWNGTCVPAHNMEPLMTFNVPVGAPAASQCGRVVFSDFHVSASAIGSGSTFPENCKAGDLSAQEKALEYMLFDLTACLTPDYVPTGGGGPTYSVPLAVTRDYEASCPEGHRPIWRFFDWMTHTPGDSKIEFYAQTGNDTAALTAAPLTPLASVSGPPVTTWTGVDVGEKLKPTPSGQMLRITIVLHPSTDGTEAPTLDAWRQSYSCVAAE